MGRADPHLGCLLVLHKIYRKPRVNLLQGTWHRISFPIISFIIYCPFPPFCLQGISHPLYLPGVQAVSQSQESSTNPFKVLGASSPGPVGCRIKCDLKHSTDELCPTSDSGPKRLQSPSCLTWVFIKQAGPGVFPEIPAVQ